MSSAEPTQDLPKTYDPAAVEAETYRVWLDEKCFEADPSKPGEPYSIVIPPPNVTGALHLGHAMNNTLQDILIRVHRMRGFNTVWIPGIDHAGIATQAVVEKQLKEKENKTRHDVGRECLVKRIWAWKQQYGDRILSQLQRLGCSCDWSRTRFTLDEMCARAVRETFFKLFKDGLVYRGKRLVNWDAHLQTSISDDEIYHETVKTFLWHIRYPIVEAPGLHPGLPGRATHMVVATTRPETLLGDTAVAVHSQDPRWNWAIGQFVELPLTGRKIPIIADDILVDMAFGSGVVKVTPGHDPNDYAVYTRHLGKSDEIAIINLLNPDGTLNENAGKYAGLKREAARKAVVSDLRDLLVKEEPYETQVGHSDRSKTPVEPYLSDQWFVKMAPLAEPALEVVRNGTIKFFPERHAQQYLSWLGEKRDWPISRQLWWGHRIPVWTFQWAIEGDFNFRQKSAAAQERERELLIEELRAFILLSGFEDDICIAGQYESFQYHICVVSKKGLEFLEAIIELTHFARRMASVQMNSDQPSLTPEIPTKINAFGDPIRSAALDHQFGAKILFTRNLEIGKTDDDLQDPDVLDTWFSSALWPHSTLGWPDRTADLARWYPTSVLMTGRDIITLWVARMVMMGMYNMGGNDERGTMNDEQETGVHRSSVIAHRSIPFHHVAINPTILDGKGERMSKSKGNGVDPVDIIDTHGADALRFTMTNMATETQDARMPVQVLCPHCGERFENPEGKAQVINCPKCKKPLTRPFENATGTEEAPLCRMTSKRFDEGRNFCTKLWNAGKFVLGNLEQHPPGVVSSPTMGALGNRIAEATTPGGALADRWIVSRFNRAVEESNTALAGYRFDNYAKACYDFFWRDFCDWYVEASKPALSQKDHDPARSAATAAVLATMLDGILRLMHPMIPFITERLWWKLNEVRPVRGNVAFSKRLVVAQWPTVGPIDSQAESTFTQLQDVIVAIRNVRNEYKIDPRKPVSVSLSVPEEFAPQIQANREMLEGLAICTITRAQANLPMPVNSARAMVGRIEVFAEGVIDPDAEKVRIAKQVETLTREREALRGRLANPSYADKAPAHLVQQTRDKLAAVEVELAKLG